MRRERWYLLLAITGLSTLIGVGLITSVATVRYNHAVRWQAHSSAVVTEIREAQTALLEAENNHKGYLLTGKKSFRQMSENDRLRVKGALTRLGDMVSDQEMQLQCLKRLRAIIASLGEGPNFLQTPDASNTAATARVLLLEMRAHEMDLLRKRSGQRDDEFSRATAMILVTCMVAFMLLLTSGLSMLNELGQRKRREASLWETQERALDASKAKSMFLARMSHEIRTPMNGILGMAELLQRTPLTPLQLKNVGIVHQSATSLLALINDILDLSKVESGRLEIDLVDFQLKRLLDEISESMAYSAAAKNLRLDVINEVPENIFFTGDPFRIRQILVNLIGNAVKFCEQGVIRVRISREVSGELQFEVQDEGPGIPLDVQKRLFNPFIQASPSTAQSFGGTGLGLSISKELVQLMGGRIGVDSAPGQGSMFWFRLPLNVAETQIYGKQNNPAESLPPSRKLRILVAEDNEINQLVMSGMLDKLGHTYDIVDNGQQALEMLTANGQYDLILMDCHMPVLDGYQAVVQIREGKVPQKEIPILAVSASAIKGEKERCLEIGMNDYLSKPLLLNDLDAKINQWAS